MPHNPFEDLRSRIERMEESLHAIEARLGLLETAHAEPERRNGEEPAPPGSFAVSAAQDDAITGTLVGRSVLIVGGAYVLRALTEAHLVGDTTGVILGLIYAIFWIFASDRAMQRGARMVALFDAGTASAIAAALIWEATTRFHILSIGFASGTVVVIALAISVAAYRHKSTELALIASIMNCVTCIGLALTSADPVAPLLGVTIFGVVISFMAWPAYVALIVAAASDTLAVALTAISAINEPAPGAEWALISYAALWMVLTGVIPSVSEEPGGRAAQGSFVAPPAPPGPSLTLGMTLQSVIATLLGAGGAAAIVTIHSQDARSVAAACLVIGVSAYAIGFRRKSSGLAGAIAIAVGTLLALTLPAVIVVWAALAALSAAGARLLGWSALTLHAVLWAAASLIPGAVITRTSPALAAVFAGAVIALLMTDRGSSRTRLALLIIATTAFLGIAFTAPQTAVVRTLVIASAAVLLSIVSDAIVEARTVARILLVVGGLKLLAEDLRVGQAATGVVALALYGCALLIVARRRSAADVT